LEAFGVRGRGIKCTKQKKLFPGSNALEENIVGLGFYTNSKNNVKVTFKMNYHK